MNLRFSAIGDRPWSMIHLTVTETVRFREIVRRRGQALCRADLANLDILPVQMAGTRSFCPLCVAQMRSIRLVRPIALPSASGLVARNLIRDIKAKAEAERPKRARRRRILEFREFTRACPHDEE